MSSRVSNLTARFPALLALLMVSGGVHAQNIITLNDLILGPNDMLPVQVGGLTPGQEHDQYLVITDALLDGRLDLELINGFQPQPGMQIQIITAAVRDGEFDSHFLPTALPAGVALEVLYPSSAPVVDVRFVPVQQGPAFVSQDTNSLWTSTENWQGQILPGFSDAVELVNALPNGNQLVQILNPVSGGGGPVQVHSLRIEGNTAGALNLRVGSNAKLSTTSDLVIDNLGRLRILSGGETNANRAVIRSGGLLAIESGKFKVGNGGLANDGLLFGDGIVEGNLTVSEGGVVLPGTQFRNPTGLLRVIGDYAQKPGSTLEIDILDDATGEFDAVSVLGTADIRGNLMANFAGATVGIGDEIEFFTAGQFTPGSVFEEIETVGLPIGLYAAPRYQTTSMAMLISGVGDMNADFVIDELDVDLFALALRSRDAYFNYDDGFGPLLIEGDDSGDTDFDGDLDFDDIDDMIALLSPPTAAYARQTLLGESIPEPASILLLGLLGIWYTNCRRLTAARRSNL